MLPPNGQSLCTGGDYSQYAANLAFQSCFSEKAAIPDLHPFTVDIYLHVIKGTHSAKSLVVTPNHLDKQLAQLNADFQDSRITFDLKNTTWYDRPNLGTGFSLGSQNGRDFYKETRQGGSTTLNVYIFPSADGNDSLAGVRITWNVSTVSQLMHINR